MDQLTFNLGVSIDLAKANPNPMVQQHGFGPQDARCKTCRFLVINRPGQNSYYKCEKRGITHGPGTDHRVRWSACSFYEEEPK